MDINMTILGIERTDDGKNRLLVLVNGNEKIPVLLNDAEVVSVNAAKAALTQAFKARKLIGESFVITV